MSGPRMKDWERELLVHNDEGMYRWWKHSRQSLRTFVREHRGELDRIMRERLDRAPAR